MSATSLAPVIQDHEEVARSTLDSLSRARADQHPVIVPVDGRPTTLPPMYRLSEHARRALGARADRVRALDARPDLLLSYARDGGRISTTEASDLVGVSPALTGEILKQLVAEGELEPSSASGLGRGFHYRPVRSG